MPTTSPHAPSTITAGRHLSHARAIAHPWTPSACHPPPRYLSPNVLPTHADMLPMPSAHPLCATTTALYVPLPPPSPCHRRHPLRTTPVALSETPPSPSPCHRCHPPMSPCRPVTPDLRRQTCNAQPARHRPDAAPPTAARYPPRPVAFTTLGRPPTAHLLVPHAPHSCPWPAPTCFAPHQCIPMCPLALAALMAHPCCLHHVPVAPIPAAPPTCHCPHRCVNPPTDASCPSGPSPTCPGPHLG